MDKDKFRQWLDEEIAAAKNVIRYYERRRDYTIVLEKIQTNRASGQVQKDASNNSDHQANDQKTPADPPES